VADSFIVVYSRRMAWILADLAICQKPGEARIMNLEQWRRVADRARAMERTELRFRLRQELNKRQDRLFSLFGCDFARRARIADATKRGNFFFGAGDVNQRLELLRQRLPDQVKQILERAEKALNHRFDLLGYTDLAYSSPIDWQMDLVNAKRAPHKAFYRVRYLDFEEVGDSKVTWELNRHQHFVTLAKAYRLTDDKRYADEILRQWRHWWAENPYPVGINWASSLEAAFRSLSWLWTYCLLEGAPGLPRLREEWLRGFALHGRHIERYLSTYFSPNTHLLGEGVALFFLGVLCPELSTAERWKATGWKIILEESRRQVQSDGFHFEQSTYYHVYALDFLSHSAILANVNNIPLPREFEQTIESMLTALYLLGRAGSPPRFGDDDGGRLFDPARNRSRHLLDPLCTGAILFNRGEFKAIAGQLREETIWLLGPEGVRAWDELEARPADGDSAALQSSALQASGIYLLSSENPATQLAADCGPLGTQSGGHGHADALSMTLTSQGRDLLIDPGTCVYTGDGGERNLFRGTAMHNTLTVDGEDQSEPAGAFSWRRFAQPKVESWIQGRSFDLLIASHDGYQRLTEPVTHRRWILSLRNGLYLVCDVVEGKGRHRVKVSWHLADDMQLIEENVFRVKGASLGLALIPANGQGWTQEVSKESWSPVYGQKSPMTVVTFATTTGSSAEFRVSLVTLLVVLEEAHGRPGSFSQIRNMTAEGRQNSEVRVYRYAGESDEHTFYFGDAGKIWHDGPMSSDADLVCWSRFQKLPAQRLIFVNGSTAEVAGGPPLRFRQRVAWGELTADENGSHFFSCEPEAAEEEAVVLARAGPEGGNRS
jgi:hypothetical protein